MKRKDSRLPIFTERFRQLQGEKSNTEFAEFLGISRQSIGFYLNGNRIPDAEGIRNIAKKCKVSSDYLLGLSDYPTKEHEHTTAAELGLSAAAIENIWVANAVLGPDELFKHMIPGLNKLLEQEMDFFILFAQINKLCEKVPIVFYQEQTNKNCNVPVRHDDNCMVLSGYAQCEYDVYRICSTFEQLIKKVSNYDELEKYVIARRNLIMQN